MQTKLCLVLSLTCVCFWADSSPAGLGNLEFDNLDTDLDQLSYEVEEEDLDDYSKLLDADDATNISNSQASTNVKTTGFKKKNSNSKGTNNRHKIKNLKKKYKIAGVRDRGVYDDDGLYAIVEGSAAKAVGVKGNEDRTYRKGTKTRGFHRVHHKDEYKKDKVFYEDDEIKGTLKKVGAKGAGFKIEAGAGFDRGHTHHDRRKGIYGKEGFLDTGFANQDNNGYSESQGFDRSFTSDS